MNIFLKNYWHYKINYYILLYINTKLNQNKWIMALVSYVFKSPGNIEPEEVESVLCIDVNFKGNVEMVQVGHDHIVLPSCDICNIDVLGSSSNWMNYFKVYAESNNINIWATKYSSFTLQKKTKW